jgi:hypothetical protein
MLDIRSFCGQLEEMTEDLETEEKKRLLYRRGKKR